MVVMKLLFMKQTKVIKMKELIINQPTKNIVRMIQKMIERMTASENKSDKVRAFDSDKNLLYYEIIQKGTYTACILIINNEIVGLGMTKRSRNDKYNARIALDVCVHKAVKDYLFRTEPEYLHVKCIEKKVQERKPETTEENYAAYATKYKECKMCGTEADCVYISQEDGLCQSCRNNEEYYEHEHRVSGN